MQKWDISIVIPCYNSEKNIERVVEGIESTFLTTKERYQIILVNDCSKDGTYQVISSLAKSKNNIIAVDLAKNSGQYGALMAGFGLASGDLVATCEDDGQTELSVFPEMIKKLDEGYDVVTSKYVTREQTSHFRRFGTKFATFMSDSMIDKPRDASFTIIFVARKYVIDELVKYDQPYPYIEGLIFRTTHRVGTVSSVQRGRYSGTSGYNLKKLFGLWLNGFTSFSIKPLRISAFIGVLSAIAGIIYAIVCIVRKILNYEIEPGWTSLITISLFLFGMVLIVLGVIGEYIGRIYMCINKTPQYVIRHIEGLNNESD